MVQHHPVRRAGSAGTDRGPVEAIAALQRYAAMRRRGYDLEHIADGWRETCGIAGLVPDWLVGTVNRIAHG